VAVAADDLVFVNGAFADLGREDLQQSAVDAFAHLVTTAVPGVEIADHRNPAGVRRPDGEIGAVGAVMVHRMGAELLVEAAMGALD
jgi:hypothetical protein